MKRLRRGEASWTDRSGRKSRQRFIAEAAIVGKKARKEGRAGLVQPDERGERGVLS